MHVFITCMKDSGISNATPNHTLFNGLIDEDLFKILGLMNRRYIYHG